MNAEKKRETARVIKFVLFSASAGIIETVAMILCEEVLKIPGHWICYTIALVLSVLWNFTFNRRYTFRSDANIPRAMALVFLFYVVFTPLSTLGGNALTDAGWNEYLVLALTMLLNFVTEYLYQRLVVYRKQIDTNDLAKKAKA